MLVLEIYQSKQGEGLWTGNFSVFVRLLGCPLRCLYCDTPYAQSQYDQNGEELGADLSPEEVVGRVLLLDMHDVVLTGGEPMISPEIVPLTRLLKEYEYQVTIETAGIVDAPVLCDLMSISPKLKNATPEQQPWRDRHEAVSSRPEIVQKLIERYNHQLKFVVDTPEDLTEIEDYLSKLQNISPDRVLLMPQAVDAQSMTEKSQWIIPYCESKGYQYCPRMQIVWYGNTRRT